MALENRVLLIALLALILAAPLVAAANRVSPLDSDHSGSDNSDSDDKKGGGSSSSYQRLNVVLYEDLTTSTNMTTTGSAVGSLLLYSTPLYKSKTYTGKVGQHYLVATFMWDDVIMVSCSLNFPNGIVTAKGAFNWAEKVGRLAVTGTTGAYIGYSGTAFMYAVDASSIKGSKRHQLVLKAFKPSS